MVDNLLGQQNWFLRASLLPELQPSALRLRLSPQHCSDPSMPVNNNNGQGEIFIFRTGTIVCWGLAEQHIKAVRNLVKPAEQGSISEQLVEDEREILAFQVEDDVATRFDRGRIVLNSNRDNTDNSHSETSISWLTSPVKVEPMVRGPYHIRFSMAKNYLCIYQVLEQFAFSHAMASSVELGILEHDLESFGYRVESIPAAIRDGRTLSISQQVIASV